MGESEVRALQERMEAQQERMEAQQERLEKLESEIAEMREGRDGVVPGSVDRAVLPSEKTAPGRSSRRELLLKAGAAAGGAVALAGAGVLPAAAENNVPLLSMLDVPVRVYDSRPGRPIGWPGPIVRGKITNTEVRSVQVWNQALAEIDSVVINLTAVETSPEGYLSAYKGDIPFPGTSTLNWSTAGDIIANSTIVTLALDGTIRVRCAGSTHFIVDLLGGFHEEAIPDPP